MADRQRIVQVLGNLLSNAAKYSPASSVIRVDAVREDLHAAVTVADEGRGISAERLTHLFRAFSCTDGEDGEREIGVRTLALPSARGSWRHTGVASRLTYIFVERRVGYWMPKGRESRQGTGRSVARVVWAD